MTYNSIRIYLQCEGGIEKIHAENRHLALQGFPSDNKSLS